jgi:hypothetical protein
MNKPIILILLSTLLSIGCTNQSLKNTSKTIQIDHIIDLTHTLTSEFPFIPVK